jgi:hypothetical protein
MMRMLFLSGVAALTLTPAIACACAPSPSCWFKYGPAYMRSICSGYAKDHKSLSQIATYLEEPDKIQDLAKACKKLGINLREK